ncbi:MAG: hypothetical protein AAF399_23715 [Bacteroidota bacterium]
MPTFECESITTTLSKDKKGARCFGMIEIMDLRPVPGQEFPPPRTFNLEVEAGNPLWDYFQLGERYQLNGVGTA